MDYNLKLMSIIVGLKNIISKMRDLGVDTDETWIEIDQNLIVPIFDGISNDSNRFCRSI